MLFGNGSYYIDIEGHGSFRPLPKAFDKFERMCDSASATEFCICAYEDNLVAPEKGKE